MRQTLIAMTLLLCAPTMAAAATHVPYEKGDFAEFENSRFGSKTTIQTDGESGNWKHYKNFGGLGKIWVWAHPNAERVYVYSQDKGTHQLLADFNARVGSTNRIDLGPCNYGDVVLGAKNVVIVTPAGKMDNCTRLDLRTSCSDAGVTSIFFKPGVGIVRYTELNITGIVTWNMTKGSISGVEYPKPTGLTVIGRTPYSEIFFNQAGPVNRLSVSIELKNDSGRPEVVNFNSSKRFDIILKDSKGNFVTSHGATIRYAQILGSETIGVGKSIKYTGSILLNGSGPGGQILAGDYTVEMYIDSSNRKATVIFPLSVKYNP